MAFVILKWRIRFYQRSSQPAVCIGFFVTFEDSAGNKSQRKFQLLPWKKHRSMEELNFKQFGDEISFYRNLNFNVLVKFILFYPLAIHYYLLFILWTHYRRLTYGIAWSRLLLPKAGCLLSSSTVLVFSGYQLSQASPGLTLNAGNLGCGRDIETLQGNRYLVRKMFCCVCMYLYYVYFLYMCFHYFILYAYFCIVNWPIPS